MKKAIAGWTAWAAWMLVSSYWADIQPQELHGTVSALFAVDFVFMMCMFAASSVWLIEDDR